MSWCVGGVRLWSMTSFMLLAGFGTLMVCLMLMVGGVYIHYLIEKKKLF